MSRTHIDELLSYLDGAEGVHDRMIVEALDESKPPTRARKEDAIAGKFAPNEKRGRGKNRIVHMTGDVAKWAGVDNYTNVKLSELPDEKLDQLYRKLVLRETLELEAKGGAAAHFKKVMQRGRMSPVDMSEYPPIKGMEGPFRFRNGRIVYYDPREGQYYDRKTDMYLSQREADKLHEGEETIDEMDTFMQHCVAKVAAKKGKDAAFAICKATGNKAGYYKQGTKALTKKGQTAVRSKAQQPNNDQAKADYEKVIDRKKPKKESKVTSSTKSEERPDTESDAICPITGKKRNPPGLGLGRGGKGGGFGRVDTEDLDETFNAELRDLMFRAQNTGGKEGKTLMLTINAIAQNKWDRAKRFFKELAKKHQQAFSVNMRAQLAEAAYEDVLSRLKVKPRGAEKKVDDDPAHAPITPTPFEKWHPQTLLSQIREKLR